VEREANRARRERREGDEFKAFLAGVGRRIAALRSRAALTQQEAAERAGLHLTLWQRLEAGTANSTILVFHDVARALEVEVPSLMKPLAEGPSRRRGRPSR